ncbi:esterase-like activity of phytase family protein [Paracoccus albus]|uniref:esterase-like activity of phytase family protein n=1 Tax=Paracoccus albus TaxID=3017784 RepID=UPI0022F08581|nr:esterase-like activity of phytase family protein [Paracoccus albus]WBU60154.1 esterase-like activity of phytase family protein [Paracoccus albus]
MSGSRHRPLILAFLISTLALPSYGKASVEYVGTFVWSLPEADFGGFSGIEISDDGSEFHILSDRATIRWGRVDRDPAGRIRGMQMSGRARLQDSQGRMLQPGWQGDSEGLAMADGGGFWVSFEGLDRVARYDDPDQPAIRIPVPDAFEELPVNSGLEALAADQDGTLYAVPELMSQATNSFPVWRFRRGEWDQPFSLPAASKWQSVGADIGPDGRLYLLERYFRGILGFQSRVRRFNLAEDGVSDEEVLLESTTLQYDNLEGISAWSDGQGIRITMVSDDNFLPIQRTELVEYRILN